MRKKIAQMTADFCRTEKPMIPAVLTETQDLPNRTLIEIVESLRQLPPKSLDDVLQFVHFLEYQLAAADDDAEDESLWYAVEANNAYKSQHLHEPMERYESGEAFMKALVDL